MILVVNKELFEVEFNRRYNQSLNMLRLCVISTTDLKAVKKSDGSWTVEGVEAEQFHSTIKISETMVRPFNATFYVTLHADECIERLIRNESDFSNLFLPLNTDSPYYHAPQTIFSGTNQFITGYVTSEHIVEGKDTASVFENVELMDLEVYIWSLIFLVTILAFIALRVYIHRRSRVDSPRKSSLIRVIVHHMCGVFYRRNRYFKLITSLYSIFCFYMMTMFLCIYKTNHVIADQPFYPKSYQQSLDYKTSFVSFYDQFVVVSDGFKSAPVSSIKRQLWDKLVASGLREKYALDLERTDPTNLPVMMTRFNRAIAEEKLVGIASSITMPLLKALGCGFSQEGELWFLKTLKDASEQEIIHGYATAKQCARAETITKNFGKAFEGHIMEHHYKLSMDVTHIGVRFAGTSKKHQWKQYLACNHEEALIPDVEVHSVKLMYFYSFFSVCAVIWIIAIIIHFLQIICQKCNVIICPRRPKRSVRRRKRY